LKNKIRTIQGYEGKGGKSKKRSKRPKTAKGVAFSRENEQLSQQIWNLFIHQEPTSSGQPSHTQHHTRTKEQETQQDNEARNSPGTVDPQVQQLSEYLQMEHYKHIRAVEQKNWQEVYNEMFSSFFQYSAKTSMWGNTETWNQDWKATCNCFETRHRTVSLVD
jgi:hypothetical protein